MAQSSIEWTMKVWNPTTGCNKVSAGCKNCYAERLHRRLQVIHPHKYSQEFLHGAFEHAQSLAIPIKWKKPTMVFVNSMSDLFHKNLSVDTIAKVYSIMFLTQRHTYQILTKRPERRLEIFQSKEFFISLFKHCNFLHRKFIAPIKKVLYSPQEIKSSFPFANVWEGTSVENQETANERVPILLQTPAAVRWLSSEPLLASIDFTKIPELNVVQKNSSIHWIVVGGESGPNKRPLDVVWFRLIRDYCKATGIPFFMKQTDKKLPIPEDLMIRQYPMNLVPQKINSGNYEK